jgi:Response regulators consisting of a CheY-like receiver domain and a winged-helix DNA-binding domain
MKGKVHILVNTPRILLADDEIRMRRLVSDFLKRSGFEVVEAEDGEKALYKYENEGPFQLVILDVMMPNIDGFAVCKQIRKTSSIPIIILTARSDEADELLGFDIGADEYISKPFSPVILVARVKALLKRSAGVKREVSTYGAITIDEVGRVIIIDNEKLDLSPKEFELLMYLSRNEGIALSREQILNAVWDFDYFGDSRTVDTHIKKVRMKLGKYEDYIQTVRGYGYKFEVEP